MKRIYLLTLLYLIAVFQISAHKRAIIKLYPDAAVDTIPKALYGLLISDADDLINGGLWVGSDTVIAHADGYRVDAIQALRELKVPMLQWRVTPQNDSTGVQCFGREEYRKLCNHLHCTTADVRGMTLQHYVAPKYRNKTIPLFGETPIDDSYYILAQGVQIHRLLNQQGARLKKAANESDQLVLSEWGILPDASDEQLAAQSTLRDALMVAMCFNTYHQHLHRLKMANMALVTNGVPALLVTQGRRMALTPTYHVLKMYTVHQSARLVPIEVICDTLIISEDDYLPMLNATASMDAKGKMTISISNVDLEREQTVTINLNGMNIGRVSGHILTASEVTAANTVDQPDKVAPAPFSNLKMRKGILTLRLPAKSVVNVALNKIPAPQMLFGEGDFALAE